jgi:hypothetical protein
MKYKNFKTYKSVLIRLIVDSSKKVKKYKKKGKKTV